MEWALMYGTARRFDLNDIHQSIISHWFETAHDETIDSVILFEAKNGNVAITCTQTARQDTSP